MPKKYYKLILAVLLLLCLWHMPYGYYQIVRLIGMVSFIYIGFEEKENEILKYFWFSSAALINPFIKIPLGKELWNAVDIIWAIILLLTLKRDI